MTQIGKQAKVGAMQQKDRNAFVVHRLLLAAAGVGLTLLALLAFLRFGVRRPSPPESATTATPPHAAPNRFSRMVAEDFRLNGGPGATPFPLIALGACRVAKPRLGGFRLGIGEVLELERLELNLPLDTLSAGTNADRCVMPATQTGTVQTVNALLTRSLDVSSFRRMAHIVAPISSATIAGLRMALVHGTNRVAILTASSARIASRSNLALRNCVFLDGDLRQVKAAKANLTNDHGWRISAENGPTVAIETVAEAVRRLEPVSSKQYPEQVAGGQKSRPFICRSLHPACVRLAWQNRCMCRSAHQTPAHARPWRIPDRSGEHSTDHRTSNRRASCPRPGP